MTARTARTARDGRRPVEAGLRDNDSGASEEGEDFCGWQGSVEVGRDNDSGARGGADVPSVTQSRETW